MTLQIPATVRHQGHVPEPPEWSRESTLRLTVGEVRHFWRKRNIVQRVVLHVPVHVQLRLAGFQEGHEACCEGGHEDGQHPEI